MLSGVGIPLHARFERTGAMADLEAAITAFAHAVQASRAIDPNLLTNLGSALRSRFQRTGTLANLDAAVEAGWTALRATPANDAGRARTLSELGATLSVRFTNTGAPEDLQALTDVCADAVRAIPRGHPDWARALSNLGVALHTRFERAGAQADLDDAIAAFANALQVTSADHPDRAGTLTNLGSALRTRFDRTGRKSDWDAALSTYEEAVGVATSAPTNRIKAARAAAGLAAPTEPGRVADLLESAVRLLPEVALRRLVRSDQQHAISRFVGLASDAAAAALMATDTPSSEPATRALRLLEAGRAILLSQSLETRSDLTDLRQQYPELAARFVELRDLLDVHADSSEILVQQLDAPAVLSQATRSVEDRRRLVDELTAILGRIRSLPKFASFGLPPTTDELLAEAAWGPVVTFNINRYRGDALLLTQAGISSLELPGLNSGAVIKQIKAFYQALHATTDPAASPAGRIASQAKISTILEWLWDKATEPVLNALGYRGYAVADGNWPRIWWVSGGLLGLLPLHAAGYHTDQRASRSRLTVMDRVVSSYTPTIRALRHARQRDSAVPADSSLIVAMSSTPGLPGRLHHVAAEARLVRSLLPRPVLLAEPDSVANDPTAAAVVLTPTKGNVLASLPSCPIVHFACHGASDPVDPSKSLLLLQDHASEPLTIASLAQVKLEQAKLAYLSACHTAFTGSPSLIDEAIHLTSAFQLAGFPQVIGTLWEIDDALAVEVADVFYTTLRADDGTLDTRQAAQALHTAIRAVRDKLPATPSLWAAYLHAGA
jgi:hypothetical protein